MWAIPIAHTYVSWSVCLSLFGTTVSPAKTAEPIEVRLGGDDLRGPTSKNRVLDGVQMGAT